MTQFLISALGSYGDVHPMIGLGTSLAARGHCVKILTNPYFEDVVRGAGLELVPIGTREQYIELSQHPDLWHPLRGPKLVLSFAGGKAAALLYRTVRDHFTDGDTVYCAHALDFGGRTAAEKLAAPLAGIDFAPSMMWSVYDTPRLKGVLTGPRVPKWLKRLQQWLSDTIFVRPLIGELNRLRRAEGLPPVRRVFARWLHDTDLTLGMFPEWFGPPQPDWPPNVRLVGFPLWDAPDHAELPTAVHEFLAAGAPPIAFAPGSANREAHQFFDAAVDACRRLDRRGILLTKYNHQLPRNLPDSIRHFGFVPLSRLSPHLAVLIHHGGVGSCARGLAAGVPQLIRPMSFDQFDNSRRLVRLGVAEEISVRKFRGPAVAGALERLLASPTVAANCREFARRCDGLAARAAACDSLEQLAGSHRAR